MKTKIWKIAERLADDVFEHLLLSRDLKSPEQQQAFFNPSLGDLSSPASFQNIDAAVERISQAIDRQQSMVVWGDFDADGVTSTAILWETLHQLGGKVMPYIPSRDVEGHGFSEVGIQKLVDDGAKLVVTVDHGITAIDEVDELKKLGIDVIITDHHEPVRAKGSKEIGGRRSEVGGKSVDSIQSTVYKLPEAISVIHPLLMDNPQPLAGCGVAYQLAYAVWLAVGKGEMSERKSLHELDTSSSREEFAVNKIELAGIGTIADMVPLLGDNRVLATHGLKALQRTVRPGLKHMMKISSISDKDVLGTYDVGFVIGPRLNAPGRLGDALESLRLLCVKDTKRAARLAGDLDGLNKQRQDLLVEVTNEAKAEVLKHEDGVFVMAKPNWPAGVCGLAAGKIVEAYHRPAVVMEQMGEMSRGSARSIKGFDFTAALTKIDDLLESYGGHAMAAGFQAKTDNLPEIERRLSELLWGQFQPEELLPELQIDAEVKMSMLDWDFFARLQQFEPSGMANPKPLFVLKNMKVVSYRPVGGEGRHLKLTLSQGKREKGKGESNENPSSSPTTHPPIEGIAFNLGHWADRLENDTAIDVAFTLDENVWNGRRSLQLMVKDLRISSE